MSHADAPQGSTQMTHDPRLLGRPGKFASCAGDRLLRVHVSANVRQTAASVSGNVRRKGPSIARRAVSCCAPLHLGIFDAITREARPGRNPQTGQSIDIPASKALRFRAGKAAKDQLNGSGQGAPKKVKV